MGNRCATQYGVTTIQGARVAVIAVQDTRRALAARVQAEVARRARIAIVAGFGVTLEHTSVLGRATVRRAGVPVIANKERVRCLTEASETFFSYGAKATIVAWDLEMNNDTPTLGLQYSDVQGLSSSHEISTFPAPQTPSSQVSPTEHTFPSSQGAVFDDVRHPSSG